MLLEEAKELLTESWISFKQITYESEKAFLRHIVVFSDKLDAQSCKVVALVITSDNGEKDLELQFNCVNGDFVFKELWFGGYDYEMFDCVEEMLSTALIDNILQVMRGTIAIIEANDLKKERWISDSCYDRSVEDDFNGNAAFQYTIRCIEKKKGIISKIFKSKVQYEIYDWNTYHCVIK